MLSKDLLFQLALTAVPHVGTVHARILVDHFGSAENIFKAKLSVLEKLEGIGSTRAKNIRSFDNYKAAEKEIKFIEQYKINPLFLNDPSYPRRLLNCYDPPTLLFYRGTADLNVSRIISVIGTRSYTEYGKHLTESLISELGSENILVVSGLAMGIDALAHKACIKNKLPTVGVLAHGLDQIYPPQHAGLAKEMIRNGGLLTEFPSNSKPDKHNFPTRNRIVAGMCDAIVVIESGSKGGSMVTAELANGYNKDVFAFPGRINDAKSLGCNYLIRNNKAILFSNTNELLESMGWIDQKTPKSISQKAMFVNLSDNEKIITTLLHEYNTLSIDELHFKSRLSGTEMAAAILNLELQNIIVRMPGKIYSLL